MDYDEIKEYEKTADEFFAHMAELEQQRELTPFERAVSVYFETLQRKDAILEESQRALKELKRQLRLLKASKSEKRS